MLGWGKSRAKKRTAEESNERHAEDAMMDASQPTVLLGHPAGHPPEVDKPRPVQELKNYTHRLREHVRESDATVQLMESVCKESDETSEANRRLSDENTTLKEQLEVERQEKQVIAEELKVLTENNAAVTEQLAKEQQEKCELMERLNQQHGEVLKMQSHTDSLEDQCAFLTEEKRELDKQIRLLTEDINARNVNVRSLDQQLKNVEGHVARLKEDLRGRDVHIKSLTEQLKDADVVAQKAAYLVSRVHCLEVDVKDAELKQKEAEDSYNMQLGISGKLVNENRQLQEKVEQLSAELARNEELLSSVSTELENVRNVAQEQIAEKERLQCLLEACEAKIGVLTENNAAVTEQLAKEQQEKRELMEKLNQQHGEILKMQSHIDSLEGRCVLLTDEKRKLNKQILLLTEDINARDVHVRSLVQQLKEADGVAQKAAFLVSCVHSLEEEVKHKEVLHKASKDAYSMQLGISGKLSQENRVLQEQNIQLKQNLEHEKAQLSVIVSQKETLESELSKQRAKEEGLCCLVQERERKVTELQQAYDAQCQHLRNVAAFAVGTSVDPVATGHVQDAEEHVRYNLRPRRKPPKIEIPGVFAMDESCVTDGTSSTALHHESLPIEIFKLPICNLPDVSTTILSHFAGRIAPKWFEVAHALGVGELATSLQQTEMSPERKCLQCLEAWINNGPELGCSWERLLKELCFFQMHSVARGIRDTIQEMSSSHHSI